MSRPKIPILLYCANEDRLSVACFSLGAQIKYRIHRASCTSEVATILHTEMLQGALVLRGAKDERALLNMLTRVPVAVCGGESVPGCVMFDANTTDALRALKEIAGLKRGPKPQDRPYNWTCAVSGAVEAHA